MVQELRANRYRLPLTTSFNQAGIPFAYPPLAFYLVGVLTDLTGIPLLTVVRFLPAVLSILAIPAYNALARSLMGKGPRAAYATTFFGLLPFSTYWLMLRSPQ